MKIEKGRREKRKKRKKKKKTKKKQKRDFEERAFGGGREKTSRIARQRPSWLLLCKNQKKPNPPNKTPPEAVCQK